MKRHRRQRRAAVGPAGESAAHRRWGRSEQRLGHHRRAPGGADRRAGGVECGCEQRILHPNDRNMAAALASRGPYSEEEILAAMRWSNGQNSNGSVSPATQQVYGMTGASLGSNSPTGNLAGDMAYDSGLRVRPQGGSSTSFGEVLPPAPSRELMNFITTNTGGASSPYQFNTAGMTYGPSPTPDRGRCSTAECAAGLAGSQGRGLLPDYMAFNPGAHTLSGAGAVSLYDGSVYAGGGVSIANVNPGFRPSGGFAAGYIFGVNDAQGVNNFLSGSGSQGGISIPVFGRFNLTLGLNHSYGGATAVEFGVMPPSGLTVFYSPWGFTSQINK